MVENKCASKDSASCDSSFVPVINIKAVAKKSMFKVTKISLKKNEKS